MKAISIQKPEFLAVVAALVFGALGCGTQINTLRSLGRLSADASGVPPILTSFAIDETSPTRAIPLDLSWGVPVGSYLQYCLLENSTDASTCVWHAGALPATYVDSAADGAFTLTAYLKNEFGTSVAFVSNAITIDRTPPNLASATVTNGNPTNQTTLALSYGSVTGGSYSAYCINLNDSAVSHCTWTTGALPTTYAIAAVDGSKVLRIWLRDAAGNVSSPVSAPGVVFDGTAPTVAITAPAASAVVNAGNAASFAASGTCTEDGEDIVISGDASATATCASGAWSASLDFSSALDGTVTISATQTDAAGNSGSDSRSFVKSVGAPTVAITAPAAGAYVNVANEGAFTVSGTCSADGRDVVLSGAVSETATCAANAWSVTLDLSAASAGPVAITADHSDAFGNAAASATRTFTKDVTAATVAIAAPAAGSYVNATNVSGFTVSGTCSENGRNVVISGDATENAACVSGAWTASLNFASAADGTVSITATHGDAAGNANATDTRSFTKDVVAPTLASFFVLNTSPTPTRGFLLSYGALSEPIGAYCILENDTNESHCTWVTATVLPDAYTVAATTGAKTLTVWIRDAAGNEIAAGVSAAAVTYSNTLVISPSGTTNLAQTYSFESVEGMRGGYVATILGNGKILVAGGCSETSGAYYSVAKLYDPTADRWTYAGHMHFPRCFAAWTPLSDGRILVAGGAISTTASTASAEVYDPTTNTWKMTYPMGTSRAHAAATLLPSGKVLVSGGYKNTDSAANTLASTEVYDPATELWLTGPTMGSKRQDHAAVPRGDGSVLLIGGSTANNAATATTDLFTPSGATGTIVAGPTMANSRADFGAVALSPSESPTGAEAILVLGGYDGNATYRTGVELYDGTSWSAKTAITGARRGAGVVKLSDGTLFVVGGYDGSYLKTTGLYKPLASAGAGSWTGKANHAEVVAHLEPLLLSDGKVFSVLGEGGYPDTGFGMTKIYNPTTNAWDNDSRAALYPNTEGSGPQTALQLASGKVFLCGGRAGTLGIERPDCYLYDPVKAAIESTEPIPAYRQGPAMAELADGRVLVMGGTSNGKSAHRNTAVIYDPATDAWSNAGTMPKYVFEPQAAPLSGNRVLWVGGLGGTASNFNSVLDTTAIYDVAGNSWSAPAGATYPSPVQYHRIVTTPAGRIFVSGGWNGSAAIADLYEWDDATTSWSARAPMGTARTSHGFAYVAGGTAGKLIAIDGYSDNLATKLGTAEIYDIATDTWSAISAPGVSTASICAQYLPATNRVVFINNVSGDKKLYIYDVGGNSWTSQAIAFEYGGAANIAGGNVCGVLNDGRFWKASTGGERSILEVLNIATPVAYSASFGDGDYAFGVSSGTGSLDARNVFIPSVPLASGASSTIRVDDGSGQNASATAKAP